MIFNWRQMSLTKAPALVLEEEGEAFIKKTSEDDGLRLGGMGIGGHRIKGLAILGRTVFPCCAMQTMNCVNLGLAKRRRSPNDNPQ
jgi:hypothetical protein